MNHYTHLTIEERESTRSLLEQGFSFRAIALKLKRSPSTISREWHRNRYANGSYAAHHAEKLYLKRLLHCGKTPKLADLTIRQYVLERIEWRWTPEQIAERAKLEQQPFSLSFVTIYRAIDSGVLPKRIRKIMRFKRKNKKRKDTDKRGKIQDTVSIHDRPAAVESRLEPGNWESDTVLGKRQTGCFGTHVERATGMLIAFYLKDRKDDVFTQATVKAFENLPPAFKKSFTVDNGKEFSQHQKLTAETGMNVYFCDPYSPWQRGTNENTNGLLRQFYPKGTSLTHVTDEQLLHTIYLINNRPRKRFGFKTPVEMWDLFLPMCCT